MKLERLPEYTTFVVTIICGIFLALYMGMSVGVGSKTPQLIIAGCFAIALALILRARIWLLIPICAPLTGKFAGMPGGFGVCHWAVAYSFAVYFVLKALKVVRAKPRFDWLDYLLLINLAYLLTAYIRNPVGTLSAGVEKIGGKPYVETAIACLGYWVLSQVTISPKLAFRLPLVMFLGHTWNLFGAIVAKIYAPAGEILARLYTGFAANFDADSGAPSSDTAAPGDEGLGRKSEWLGPGGALVSELCSYFSPSSLLNPFNLLRFILFALACIGVLKSGFRSALLSIALFFFFASYFRSGLAAALRIPILCLPLVGLLVLGQGGIFDLPLNIQRSLSFLPGKWDYLVTHDAKFSTDWRHEIWATVWDSGDKYIKNWWLGDGFGMTRAQLRESLQKDTASQENLTISGDYHSLPLTTIHTVGYVGLALLLVEMGGMTIYAWKLIRKAKGTPFFPLALFIGIPVVYSIPYGMLIYGSFKTIVASNIYAIAWLRLAQRSLNAYLQTPAEAPTKSIASLPEFPSSPFSRNGIDSIHPKYNPEA